MNFNQINKQAVLAAALTGLMGAATLVGTSSAFAEMKKGKDEKAAKPAEKGCCKKHGHLKDHCGKKFVQPKGVEATCCKKADHKDAHCKDHAGSPV